MRNFENGMMLAVSDRELQALTFQFLSYTGRSKASYKQISVR
jgi:hypothetical protein